MKRKNISALILSISALVIVIILLSNKFFPGHMEEDNPIDTSIAMEQDSGIFSNEASNNQTDNYNDDVTLKNIDSDERTEKNKDDNSIMVQKDDKMDQGGFNNIEVVSPIEEIQEEETITEPTPVKPIQDEDNETLKPDPVDESDNKIKVQLEDTNNDFGPIISGK